LNAADAPIASPSARSGAGARGAKCSSAKINTSIATATRSVATDVDGSCSTDGQHVAEESGLDDVNAKQFRNLIHHDDQTDGGFEPGQHRLGDEVGDEAETKRACQQEQDTNQHRQRRRRRYQFGAGSIRRGHSPAPSR
jgi:hypothetical protein